MLARAQHPVCVSASLQITGSKQEWYDEARHGVLLENFPVRGAFSQIYTSHEIYCCTRHTHTRTQTQTHVQTSPCNAALRCSVLLR